MVDESPREEQECGHSGDTKFSEDQRDLVQEGFDTYGPIPRFCIHPGLFTYGDMGDEDNGGEEEVEEA
jgi:hypothetical protein